MRERKNDHKLDYFGQANREEKKERNLHLTRISRKKNVC